MLRETLEDIDRSLLAWRNISIVLAMEARDDLCTRDKAERLAPLRGHDGHLSSVLPNSRENEATFKEA